MAKAKEPRTEDPVLEAEKSDLQIDDFILALKNKKGYIRKNSKSKSFRYFWGCDDDDWFYMSGSSLGLKKRIEISGMWIRKDLKSYLEHRKEEGYEFFLEKK
jgi:hypothetical protein